MSKIKVPISAPDEEKAKAMDWLESHLDDLSIRRDLSKGTTVELSFCSRKSTCPVDITSSTILGAVKTAWRMGEE